jgi:paraquat-inducible protein A
LQNLNLAFFLQRESVREVQGQLIGCENCGQIQLTSEVPRGKIARCARCSAVIERSYANSRTRTLALTLAALFLYLPANIYPIMNMDYMGRHTENTVWGGVQALYRDGMWAIAAIVFAASILIPLLKLCGLFFIVIASGRRWQKARNVVFQIIGKLGPWAMLDVFLLSILVALLRFGRFATVIPGPGVYAFTAVVILTLFASASFNPRLIWNQENEFQKI